MCVALPYPSALHLEMGVIWSLKNVQTTTPSHQSPMLEPCMDVLYGYQENVHSTVLVQYLSGYCRVYI